MHLVGIAASPGGGGVFGTMAEEELRQWLDTRLDELGIDPVAYSRFILSFLRHPDSALTPPGEVVVTGKGKGRRSRARPKTRLPLQEDKEKKRAVVQCLASAADQKCGVETLVDELCAKLRDLEGGASKTDEENLEKDVATKPALETLTPQDRALRYYAAFPALQPATPKKFQHRKDKNLGPNIVNNNNSNNNINNNNSNNNRNGIGNKNNKNRQKKTKMSITIESQHEDEKEGFGFVKLMERERDGENEKEQEIELDKLRLAQLTAKFDESLEALWDTASGNKQGTDSIWAAPSLSIPSKPLWPTDGNDTSFTVSTSSSEHVVDTPFQESIVDDSPLIPWDLDLVGTKDCSDETANKNNTNYNVTWSETLDGSWCWRSMDKDIVTNANQSPEKNENTILPSKNNETIGKEARFAQKVNSIQEPDEDLLTSARTHFRPIRDDGHWADGTTFPVNDALERVAYRRSDSGNLLYLPGGESPYMEYREGDSAAAAAATAVSSTATSVSTNLTLKFRVRQCDKSIQTEPIRSPVKRRILSEQDRVYYSSSDVEETAKQEIDDTEKDCFFLEQLGWAQSNLLLHNERKRRYSSSFSYRPLTALRPLTL